MSLGDDKALVLNLQHVFGRKVENIRWENKFKVNWMCIVKITNNVRAPV